VGAFEDAVASMESRAPRSLRRVILNNADRFEVYDLDRLTDIVAGRAYRVHHRTPLLGDLLTRAELCYSVGQERGKAGHWTFDMNRQIALAGIIVALRRRKRAALRRWLTVSA